MLGLKLIHVSKSGHAGQCFPCGLSAGWSSVIWMGVEEIRIFAFNVYHSECEAELYIIIPCVCLFV